VYPDPHHFGNLDLHLYQIKNRIRIKVISWIRNRIRINLQMTSQNVLVWNMSPFKHFSKGLILYLEARIWIRIRTRIRIKSRIRIRIKKLGSALNTNQNPDPHQIQTRIRIRIRIRVISRIRIRIKVMRIHNTAKNIRMVRIRISGTPDAGMRYLALSSLTHLSGPVAVTVAARGLSNINAISPK
jgi:hypothetical protein